MKKKIKPIKTVGDRNQRIIDRDCAIQQLQHNARLADAITDIKDLSEIIPELDSLIFEDDELHKAKLERLMNQKLSRIDRSLKILHKFVQTEEDE